MTALDALTVNSPIDFAHALEQAEGWPATAANDSVLVAWQQAEGLSSFDYMNPLNTTQKEAGATYGGGAVAHYPDWATALQGTIDALNSGRGQWYAAIRNDLAAGASAQQTAHDIEASPWASGHYGATAPDYAGGNIERILGSPGWTPSNVTAPAGAPGSPSNPAQLTVSNPFDWLQNITSGAQKGIAGIVLRGVFLAGGAVLIVLGAWRSVSPQTRQTITSTAALAAVA